MAKNVQNSHFSFARNIILVENKRLRSSPLLEAAERWEQGANASLPMGAPSSQHALSRNWEQRKARAHWR
jgi:hypothetical protein